MQTALLAAAAALVITCIALVLGLWDYLQGARVCRRISVLAQAAVIPTLRVARPLIEKELGRARRYERVLSIAVFQIRSEELMRQIQMLMKSDRNIVSFSGERQIFLIVRIVFALAARILRDAVREEDIVAYDPDTDRYIVVMPETDKAQAQEVAVRVCEVLLRRTSAEVRFSAAEFPGDGLALEDLIRTREPALGARRAGVVADEPAA